MTLSIRPTFALLSSLLTLAVTSRAAVTVVANFHLGEADAGAVAGNPAGSTTKNSAGIPDLTLVGTAPVYTASTGVSGSATAMDFTNGGYASAPLITTNNN